MSNSVITITDSQFSTDVLAVPKTVLVYFWAAWCGPCRLMSPAIEWAASNYTDHLKVVKMEIDPNPETVAKYSVQGVPALILFKDGQQIDAIEGAINKQKLEHFLSGHLSLAL